MVMSCGSDLLDPDSPIFTWPHGLSFVPRSQALFAGSLSTARYRQISKYIFAIFETLFIAHKVIARNWMQTPPPPVWSMGKGGELHPPIIQKIDVHRGCPAKYNKVWDSHMPPRRYLNYITTLSCLFLANNFFDILYCLHYLNFLFSKLLLNVKIYLILRTKNVMRM